MEENQNNCCASNYQMKHLIVMLMVLGLIAIGIISLLRERIVNPTDHQISFTAEGRAFAKPDIAQIQVAVKTDRVKESIKAVKQNTEQMNKVVNKLKELGIEEKDIKTTTYSLNPVYDYNREMGQQTLAGYEVYQGVTVKIRNLDKVGEIIEATTNVGANQVGDVTFTIDDTEEVQKIAREEAVKKAEQKAKETAKLTGIKLGKLINVIESEGYVPVYRDYSYTNKLSMEAGAMAPAPDIQVGENEIKLSVTLIYDVR